MKSKYKEFIKENFFEWDPIEKQIYFYFWVKRYKKYGVGVFRIKEEDLNEFTLYGVSGKQINSSYWWQYDADELYYYKSGNEFYKINKESSIFFRNRNISWTYLINILWIFKANEELYENCLKLNIDPETFIVREKSPSPIKAFQASVETLRYCAKNSIQAPYFIEFVKKHRKRLPSICKQNWIPDLMIQAFMNNEKQFDQVLKFVHLNWWEDYRRQWEELFQAKIITKKTFAEFPQTQSVITKMRHFYEDHEELLKEKRNEKLQEEYAKIYTDKFDYSSRFYTINLCKSIQDLVTEGTVLSHCVARFAESISQGREQIFFFRKKATPDTPFFTVNVAHNKIKQIHGKYNKNLPTKYYAFICKWAKLNNFEFDEEQINTQSAEEDA